MYRPDGTTYLDCEGCGAYLDIFGSLSAAGLYKRDPDSLAAFCLFISSQTSNNDGNGEGDGIDG
jgi:hypothetical protein